jgi:hypothetical protein
MQDIEIGKRDTTSYRTPGFQRMRLDWSSDDRDVLIRAKSTAEGRLQREFPEVYRLLYRVYNVVRAPEVDPQTGEIHTDQWGLPVWQKDQIGSYLEDFSKLGIKEKEDILFTITTHLVEWQQLAADAWGEAMFAKAQWEERFSIGYDAPMSGTIEARTATGRLDSREERYFAIFISLYSRKADALIRSLELLGQRLKDSMLV